MDRSAVKALRRKGQTVDQIAEHLGMDRKTVMGILKGPTEPLPQVRDRATAVDPFRTVIEDWISRGVPVKRMLELAAESEPPYTAGRSEFYRQVAEIRRQLKAADQEVFVRFEAVPGEYCQIDWGEIRNFHFDRQPAATRYFFCARLKFSRMSYVEFTSDTKLETLLRCMLRAFEYFGGVPWNCVFDNMKTVTSGRDEHQKPIWNATFLKMMFELECHPLACWPASGNQKGAVENLVGWVKSNFIPERSFLDDADLAEQIRAWLVRVNERTVSAGNGEIPKACFDLHERKKLTPLQTSSQDYGLKLPVVAGSESLVSIDSNRYSVPVGLIGRPLLARLRSQQIDFYSEDRLVASHPRAPKALKRPIRIPEHYAPVFKQKPRAQVMLYRDHLLGSDLSINAYVAELCKRFRGGFDSYILRLYELLQEHGADDLGAACAVASEHEAYGTDYLVGVLRPHRGPSGAPLPTLEVAGPDQAQLDRDLAGYEAFVHGGGGQ